MMFEDATFDVSRRDFLTATAVSATAAVAATALTDAAAASTPKMEELKKVLEFKNPKWNRDSYAKLQGNLDEKSERYGYFRGEVLGVRDGEAVRPILGFEGFSVARLQRAEDGSWKKMLREVGYYKDLATDKILDTWTNPYTNETVKVVHIANDPFNYIISENYPDPPNKGGFNTGPKPPKRPLLLNWRLVNEDLVTLSNAMHLYYKSPLQPDKWPRESPGTHVRASEMYRYNIKASDLADPNKTGIDATGVWNRITPWLPWMLMDGAPGHVFYAANMASSDDISIVPPDLIEYATRVQPQYLSAPKEYIASSESSLELYAKQQTPAPRKAGT
jgi:hypothetical protein